MGWHCDRHNCPGSAAFNRQPALIPIEQEKALRDVGQPDPGMGPLSLPGFTEASAYLLPDPISVILYGDSDMIPSLSCLQADHKQLLNGTHTMDKTIFHNGLEDHGGDLYIFQLLGIIDLHL